MEQHTPHFLVFSQYHHLIWTLCPLAWEVEDEGGAVNPQASGTHRPSLPSMPTMSPAPFRGWAG